MPLTEEEKQALMEKYKEQRRAIWAGKRSPRRSDKETPDLPGETGTSLPHEQEDAIEAEQPADTPSARLQSDRSTSTASFRQPSPPAKSMPLDPPQEADQEIDKIPYRSRPAMHVRESFQRLRKTNERWPWQVQQNEGESYTIPTNNTDVSYARLPHQTQDATPTTDRPDSPSLAHAVAQNDAHQIKEKIREQRENTWEGQSAIRSRRKRQRRETGSKERQFWNPSDKERKPSMLTWKLALGVVGTIIVLIGIGVLLGYLFAS